MVMGIPCLNKNQNSSTKAASVKMDILFDIAFLYKSIHMMKNFILEQIWCWGGGGGNLS